MLLLWLWDSVLPRGRGGLLQVFSIWVAKGILITLLDYYGKLLAWVSS